MKRFILRLAVATLLGNPGRLVDTGKTAVRGKLTKWKDGRKIAERELSFDVKYLGC